MTKLTTIAALLLFSALPSVAVAGESLSSPLSRGSAVQLFTRANELYSEAKRLASEGKGEDAKGKFGEAEVVYEDILARGFVNWQVHYNLGNALYQQGALGKAIACYRRAERLAPRQEDIQINLERAESQARDKEALPAAPGYVRALLFPYFQLTVDEVTIAALAAYLLFGGLLLLAVFVRGAWTKVLCVLALLAALALGGALGAKVLIERRAPRGVVVSEVCAVRLGHGAEYEKRFEAHDGAELVVLGRYRDPQTKQQWLKVRLFIELQKARPAPESEAEGTQARAEGWVEAKAVELL